MNSNIKKQRYVEVKGITWQKDSHGLFDYECKNLSIVKFRVESDSKIMREDVQLKQFPIHSLNSEHENLISITRDPNGNFLGNPRLNHDVMDQSQRVIDSFLIVRSLKNQSGEQTGYALKVGNILKLGRIEFLVMEMMTGSSKEPTKYFSDEILSKISLSPDKVNMDNHQCRICLDEGLPTSQEHAFITPCLCKGSCEYVHLYCMRMWIKNKMVERASEGSVIYNCKKMECEVCGHPLPKSINLGNGQIEELIEYRRPENAYIILETINNDKNRNKCIVVIEAKNDQDIKIGRAHQCDVRISDISVSRVHSMVKFVNGQFLIFDNSSKFGTLIHLNQQFEINNEKIAIQIGRSVLTLATKSANNSSTAIGPKLDCQEEITKMMPPDEDMMEEN